MGLPPPMPLSPELLEEGGLFCVAAWTVPATAPAAPATTLVIPVATSFTLSITRPALVLALRPAARILVVADFTFLVMALFLAATLRRVLEALRLILAIMLARLLPPLRAADLFAPRLAGPREDFFADRFALAAITAPF